MDKINEILAILESVEIKDSRILDAIYAKNHLRKII